MRTLLENTVVRTKLLPPRLHQRIMARPRLIRRLLEALDYRLTILQAGAGYGKSTALAAPASTTINVLAMTIVGGAGTLTGPVLGAAIVHLLGYWLNRLFGPNWVLLFGITFILIVMFLPYGIVGTVQARSWHWRAIWRQRLEQLRRTMTRA